MKLLKHILVVVALLLAALPCVHAESHDRHLHSAVDAVDLCAPHDCSCHSCDHAAIPDELVMHKGISATSALAIDSLPSILLFTVVVSGPAGWPPEPRYNKTLASIQTVRLLI